MTARRWIPCGLTFLALAAGVMALVAAFQAQWLTAARLIMTAMILDGLDGRLARRWNASGAFGAELDTYVDLIAFGLAPAILAWRAVFPPDQIHGWIWLCLAVASGAGRLARFKALDDSRGEQGYLGLPITVFGGWIAAGAVLQTAPAADTTWLPAARWLWLAVASVLLILQLSTIRYDKQSRYPAIFIAGILCTLGLFLPAPLRYLGALGLALYGIYFAFFSVKLWACQSPKSP
ncbi:MAG: CDP-alcohol phosphatidyltransferase family protein [Candidatus Marinimicrobia bacterium]|nr:CDP-alcohol phosphatidyltransferase family protein [Candidatus Neomarinimicrobiota bacterium]